MSAAARCSSSGKDRKKAYIKAQKGDNLQEIVLVFSVDLHFARSKICYEWHKDALLEGESQSTAWQPWCPSVPLKLIVHPAFNHLMSNVNFQESKPLDPHPFSAAQGVKSPLASKVGGTAGRVWAATVCRCPVWEEAMACPVTSAPADSDTTINEPLCAKTSSGQGSVCRPCTGRFNKEQHQGKEKMQVKEQVPFL